MQDGSPADETSSLTLAIDAGLLEQARDSGIDPPTIVDRALRAEIARCQRAKDWCDENQATIEAWNEDVRQNGLWSDGLRLF